MLVTPTGIVKVADFGASKPFGDPAKTDMMKSLRGSAFWMAPEILRGSGYGKPWVLWVVFRVNAHIHYKHGQRILPGQPGSNLDVTMGTRMCFIWSRFSIRAS